MKSNSTYFAGFSLLSLLLLSCSKNDPRYESERQPITPQVIEANVPAGQAYVYQMGVGTTATIRSQAAHYQLSEVATARDGSVSYKYIASKGYTGADQVTLQQSQTYFTSGGGCHSNNTNGNVTTAQRTIVIKLNVAN